jgi:hypothetical protein
LKVNCDVLLSTSAFKINLRRFIKAAALLPLTALFRLGLPVGLPDIPRHVITPLHAC